MTGHGSSPRATLLDAARLAGWVAACGLGNGPVEVEPLGEGHSNLTFLVRSAARSRAEWVLRRPPLGPLLPTAHDVVREFRVLDLLGRSGAAVRVPRVVAVCEDADVIGAPFYLMERVNGVVIRDTLPPELTGDGPAASAARHALGLDLVDALAELHAAPYAPFVAAGIGRPEGYLARQLRRWVGQREGIEAAVAAAGGRARALPDYETVRDWLRAHLPAHLPAGAPPAVVHGDYKLDNVIVAGGPRVAAIVDWEMATVGDPLADLGYLLSFWPEPGERLPLTDLGPVAPGLPTRGELVARWAAGTGRDPGDLTWYVTLAIWKLAILLEASYHRWLAGTADDPLFPRLEAGVPALLARARDTCGA